MKADYFKNSSYNCIQGVTKILPLLEKLKAEIPLNQEEYELES